MLAYPLKKHGGTGVLKIKQVDEPEPSDSEVKVKISHIGINYAEILSRRGQYRWAPKKPYIPGMEAYGTIEAVGPGVNRRVGEEVIVGAQYGAYAEKIVLPAYLAFPKLPDFSDAEQAAFLVNYMTAWVALVKQARMIPEDRVLVTAAAGGVGTAAVQIAKNYGCQVLGTASKDYKIKLLNDLNIDAAINYLADEWDERVRQFNDGGVDVVLELVGGDTFQKVKGLLNPFGRIVIAGVASIKWSKTNPLSWASALQKIPRFDIRKMAIGSNGILATHIGYLIKDKALSLKLWEELSTFTRAHHIKPVISHIFDFDQLPQAHEYIESRKSYGKVVVKVNA
jgi:NADPH:quinone reductase-like Zn-dependent oxidoreductase